LWKTHFLWGTKIYLNNENFLGKEVNFSSSCSSPQEDEDGVLWVDIVLRRCRDVKFLRMVWEGRDGERPKRKKDLGKRGWSWGWLTCGVWLTLKAGAF